MPDDMAFAFEHSDVVVIEDDAGALAFRAASPPEQISNRFACASSRDGVQVAGAAVHRDQGSAPGAWVGLLADNRAGQHDRPARRGSSGG